MTEFPKRAPPASFLDSGREGRSGELLPYLRFESGCRAGIRVGLRVVFVDDALASCGFDDLAVSAAMGVLVVPLDPEVKWPTLLARLNGAGFDIVPGVGVGAGVLDRGPGPGLASSASIQSRYRSPCTRNGRPYSSSHCSRALRNSAMTFGRSLAIRFLIFSSRNSLPGSRLSPFWPRVIRREASWLDDASSFRSCTRLLCLSTSARVGAR